MNVVKFAELKQANNLVVLDLRKVSNFCDFFVIASGNSRPHIRAIAEGVTEGLRERNKKLHSGQKRVPANPLWRGAEGYQEGRWVVLDFSDVIVHIFDEEARSFYDLERLWAAAKKINLT